MELKIDADEKTIEYYPGKKLDIEYWKDCKEPHLITPTDEVLLSMSKEEYNAFAKVHDEFHDHYWPSSTLRIPIRKPLEREELDAWLSNFKHLEQLRGLQELDAWALQAKHALELQSKQ